MPARQLSHPHLCCTDFMDRDGMFLCAALVLLRPVLQAWHIAAHAMRGSLSLSVLTQPPPAAMVIAQHRPASTERSITNGHEPARSAAYGVWEGVWREWWRGGAADRTTAQTCETTMMVDDAMHALWVVEIAELRRRIPSDMGVLVQSMAQGVNCTAEAHNWARVPCERLDILDAAEALQSGYWRSGLSRANELAELFAEHGLASPLRADTE